MEGGLEASIVLEEYRSLAAETVENHNRFTTCGYDYLFHLSMPSSWFKHSKINCGFPQFSLLVARLLLVAVQQMPLMGD